MTDAAISFAQCVPHMTAAYAIRPLYGRIRPRSVDKCEKRTFALLYHKLVLASLAAKVQGRSPGIDSQRCLSFFSEPAAPFSWKH